MAFSISPYLSFFPLLILHNAISSFLVKWPHYLLIFMNFQREPFDVDPDARGGLEELGVEGGNYNQK